MILLDTITSGNERLIVKETDKEMGWYTIELYSASPSDEDYNILDYAEECHSLKELLKKLDEEIYIQ